jgi:hypothetical protein
VDDGAYGPVSVAALRDAVLKGREPPPAQIVARLSGYRCPLVGFAATINPSSRSLAISASASV